MQTLKLIDDNDSYAIPIPAVREVLDPSDVIKPCAQLRMNDYLRESI